MVWSPLLPALCISDDALHYCHFFPQNSQGATSCSQWSSVRASLAFAIIAIILYGVWAIYFVLKTFVKSLQAKLHANGPMYGALGSLALSVVSGIISMAIYADLRRQVRVPFVREALAGCPCVAAHVHRWQWIPRLGCTSSMCNTGNGGACEQAPLWPATTSGGGVVGCAFR